MIYQYFTNFPIINYENVNVRDLSRKVVLSKQLRRIPTVFHPFELQNEMRADTLAYTYYKDVDADWLINITNGIVDPYYGWYLEEDEFINFIRDKYGSIEEPQQRVFFWQTNWVDDEFDLQINGFDSMPAERQKYWMPVFGGGNDVIRYRRRKEDWRMNTNRIIDITIANTASFAVGDLVVAYNNGEYVGRAEINTVVSSTRLFLLHIQDDWEVGSEIRLRDTTSQTIGSSAATGPTITAVRTVYENITDEESTYWEPIYFFDYERMKNENNKIVMLLDANYLNEAALSLKQKLSE